MLQLSARSKIRPDLWRALWQRASTSVCRSELEGKRLQLQR